MIRLSTRVTLAGTPAMAAGGGLAGKEMGATGCREVKFVRLLNGKDCSAGQLAKLNTFVFII